MKKIKPLTKKYRLRRWLRRLFGIKPRASDLLTNIDEMHEVPVKFPTMYFVCPFCGARTPMEAPRPRPDGYTIAQTIIDENPRAEFEEKGECKCRKIKTDTKPEGL